jgi:hypothetical protein
MHRLPRTGSGLGFLPPKRQLPPWRRKQRRTSPRISSINRRRTAGSGRYRRFNWWLICSGTMVATPALSREILSWTRVWKLVTVNLLRLPVPYRASPVPAAQHRSNLVLANRRFRTFLVAPPVEESFSPETAFPLRQFDSCDVLRSAARGDGGRAALGPRPSN